MLAGPELGLQSLRIAKSKKKVRLRTIYAKQFTDIVGIGNIFDGDHVRGVAPTGFL